MTILKSVNTTDEMEWVEVCQFADITPNAEFFNQFTGTDTGFGQI